jgi:S1-C subfamily serine protease
MTIGLFLGLFLGVLIQGKLINFIQAPLYKAVVALVVITVVAGLLSGIGSYMGIQLRQTIERARRLRIISVLDRFLGAAVGGATLLGAVWLCAALLNNVPQQTLQRQIRNSVIIVKLNDTLPPVPNVVARLGQLINPNGYPDVFAGLEPTVNTNAPLPSIGTLNSVVNEDRASVVKVEGLGCGGITQGSGFVAGNGLVITDAHVVAGVNQPLIMDTNGQHSTTVVWFDPNLDVAILRSSYLAGQPLVLNTATADRGIPGAVLGYPGGGLFTAQPATVLSAFTALGRNIYNQGSTERQIYSIKATVRPGNSGGPLVNEDGQVFGVVFAESTNYNDIGYALTMKSVAAELNQAKNDYQPVGTGGCAQ